MGRAASTVRDYHGKPEPLPPLLLARRPRPRDRTWGPGEAPGRTAEFGRVGAHGRASPHPRARVFRHAMRAHASSVTRRARISSVRRPTHTGEFRAVDPAVAALCRADHTKRDAAQAMLGHVHVTTTMRYVHDRPPADDATGAHSGVRRRATRIPKAELTGVCGAMVKRMSRTTRPGGRAGRERGTTARC
jgi:hypothetical protein